MPFTPLRIVCGLALAWSVVLVVPSGTAAAPVVAPLPPADVVVPPPIIGRPPVAPPPGTLGRTYLQRSRPVPKDRHPRIAMIDIIAPPEATAVAVDGLEDLRGFLGPDGVWHFESKNPLLPTVPHIYVVRARILHDGFPTAETRVVRLIPGRVVFLAF